MATRGTKRPRFTPSTARPIDKKIVVVNQALTTSQTATTLLTVTFPCTLVGLRWSFDILAVSTAGDALDSWAIVVVRDGNTVSTISQSNAADFYTPEQNVLTFGVHHTPDRDGNAGPRTQHFEGFTKTMRKLMGGDTIQCIAISDLALSSDLDGAVQFFCKT